MKDRSWAVVSWRRGQRLSEAEFRLLQGRTKEVSRVRDQEMGVLGFFLHLSDELASLVRVDVGGLRFCIRSNDGRKAPHIARYLRNACICGEF